MSNITNRDLVYRISIGGITQYIGITTTKGFKIRQRNHITEKTRSDDIKPYDNKN